MDNHTLPTQPPHTKTPYCCTPSAAWQWASCLAELAVVYGDDDARRWLSVAVDHALRMGRAVGAA